METSVLITLSSTDFETLIMSAVNTALQLNNMATDVAKVKHDAKTPLTIDKACEITGLAKSTIYYLAPKSLIPCKKSGKRLYFFEDELLAWIKSGRRNAVTAKQEKEVPNVNR